MAIINRAPNQIDRYVGGRDPFENFAAESAPRDLVGQALRFVKGDFVRGNEPVPLGSTMLVVMPLLLNGWVKWVDGKPAARVLARVAVGERPPARVELGDNDQSRWPRDQLGTPRDPWAATMYLPMLRAADADACTFVTSSWGGKKAIGELARSYARGRPKDQPDSLPLVELGSHTRQSRDYGQILEPVFSLAAWAPLDDYRLALNVAGILELLESPKSDAASDPDAQIRRQFE